MSPANTNERSRIIFFIAGKVQKKIPACGQDFLLFLALALVKRFVGYREFFSSFSSSRSQYSTTIFRSHTASETMLVSAFSLRRLERSFHRLLFFSRKGSANIRFFLRFQIVSEKKSISFRVPKSNVFLYY